VWLDADFRRFPEGAGLPEGWEDASAWSGATAHYSIVCQQRMGFLRIRGEGKGTAQMRLPLADPLDAQRAFEVRFIARSSSNAGVLMGLRAWAKPEESNEIDAAVLTSVDGTWREYCLPARGGPVAGPAAFYLNFGTPGEVDLAHITVVEIPEHKYVPATTLVRGHVENWDGGWLNTHWGHCLAAAAHPPRCAWWGDSLTAGWLDAGKAVWQRDLMPLVDGGIQNLGIGGDTVQTVRWRMRDARLGEAFAPPAVILMIGVNNLFHIDSPVDIAAGMDLLLGDLAECLPRSRVLLLGAMPVGYDAKGGIRRRIADVNRRYAASAAQHKVTFADVGSAILEADGSISKTISDDGTHLNAIGYERLARAAVPLIRELVR
jgi:beta-glucosidase